MNKTCLTLAKHSRLWSLVTIASMTPAYPTVIRGQFDSNIEQEDQGTD